MYTSTNRALADKVKVKSVSLGDLLALIGLIMLYIIDLSCRIVTFGKLNLSRMSFFNSLSKAFDHHRKDSIARMGIIDLAARNMEQKRSRTMVTIGGMAIGIAIIVFLVSIGYGLQQIVISRVARLEEMKQTDLLPQVRGKVPLDSKSLNDLKNTTGVVDAQPLVAVVGHVNYNSSATDIVAYGVTTKYLESSAIRPIAGKLFENNEQVVPNISPTASITPSVIPITPTVSQKIDKESEWVSLEPESEQKENTTTVKLPDYVNKNAVVNQAFVKVLGLTETQAIGKKFEVTFVIVGELLPNGTDSLQSIPAEFTIVGVTPDTKSPIMYLPLVDLLSLGITKYSQAKITVSNESILLPIRKQAEAMGFVTNSVVDTVAQINALFATARIILLILGMVALAVAALGMFNTLTVSLLERTREVGLMKAMGMRSVEIQELFLSESIMMGIVGGLLGLLGGYLGGKLVSLILSFFSLSKGIGFVDISSIPLAFIGVIILLSFTVGILTGVYPAKRATKISALNALRYE